MLNIIIPVDEAGSNSASIETFLYNKEEGLAITNRPLVIICPGGGYNHISVREGESIAFQFNAMGYHAAVLKYSVSPSQYPTQLFEVGFCVKYFKDNSEKYGIDAEKIFLFGASAGAHLAALFATGYYRTEITKHFNVSDSYLKPLGLILAYPVITSGEFAHKGSFEMLIGNNNNKPELLKNLSIENRINERTPKCFIWHTFEDGTVPLENSMLLINALRKNNIPFEYHVFPSGCHGLALANELTLSPSKKENNPASAQWISLCRTWLQNLAGSLV